MVYRAWLVLLEQQRCCVHTYCTRGSICTHIYIRDLTPQRHAQRMCLPLVSSVHVRYHTTWTILYAGGIVQVVAIYAVYTGSSLAPGAVVFGFRSPRCPHPRLRLGAEFWVSVLRLGTTPPGFFGFRSRASGVRGGAPPAPPPRREFCRFPSIYPF